MRGAETCPEVALRKESRGAESPLSRKTREMELGAPWPTALSWRPSPGGSDEGETQETESTHLQEDIESTNLPWWENKGQVEGEGRPT